MSGAPGNGVSVFLASAPAAEVISRALASASAFISAVCASASLIMLSIMASLPFINAPYRYWITPMKHRKKEMMSEKIAYISTMAVEVMALPSISGRLPTITMPAAATLP